MHPCRRNNSILLLAAALLGTTTSIVLVAGSYPDPVQPVYTQLEHPQTQQQHPISEQGDGDAEDNDKSTSSQECLMPCPHIYDPVCGSTFGDNSAEEELREFPNECSMNRFNCEWNQHFRVVDAERCAEKTDSSMSGAASSMKMHLP